MLFRRLVFTPHPCQLIDSKWSIRAKFIPGMKQSRAKEVIVSLHLRNRGKNVNKIAKTLAE